MTDNMDYWLDGSPIVAAGGDNEFAIWLDDAPVVESDVTIDVVVTRRRVMMSFVD